MSVPAYRRKKGKLEVEVKARQLFATMLKAVSNPKKFDPIYYDLFTKRWLEKLESAYLNCWRANNILVKTKQDYEKRKSLQNEAIRDLLDFLALLSSFKEIYKAPARRIIYWTDKTLEVVKLIQAWKTSDRERYGKIEEDAG